MEEEFELPKNAKKTIKRLWQSVNDQYLTIDNSSNISYFLCNAFCSSTTL